MSTQLQPIQDVLHNWILAGQALVGSVGALAFIAALTWMSRDCCGKLCHLRSNQPR